MFEAVHRGRSKCDIDGATAELDFRLAVLAQSIDAALPLTLLAAASSGEALARFARSAKFRVCIEQGARDVTTAFSAGRHLANANTMTAKFPLCLSEALHAAKRSPCTSLPPHLECRRFRADQPLARAPTRSPPERWPMAPRADAQ